MTRGLKLSTRGLEFMIKLRLAMGASALLLQACFALPLIPVALAGLTAIGVCEAPNRCGQVSAEHKARLAGLKRYFDGQALQVGSKGKPCARYLVDRVWVDLYDCGPDNEFSNYEP